MTLPTGPTPWTFPARSGFAESTGLLQGVDELTFLLEAVSRSRASEAALMEGQGWAGARGDGISGLKSSPKGCVAAQRGGLVGHEFEIH